MNSGQVLLKEIVQVLVIRPIGFHFVFSLRGTYSRNIQHTLN
jgi:hypothetical protein